MTEAEQMRHRILSKLSENVATFAVPVGAYLGTEGQEALEWMLHNRWLTLIDISPLATDTDHLYRIFLASDEAVTWYRKQL